jgi:hypothetical protein
MLRERYEQVREQALERAGSGPANTGEIRWGMRSWMEAGSQPENSTVRSAPVETRSQPGWEFSQMVAVWASVLVWQAERSYRGQREA